MSPHTASPSGEARLAERQTPAGLASTLAWTATGALVWLKRLSDHEINPADLAKLADYGRRLREIADQLDNLCEGNDA